jgi:hypothetical protein
MKVQRRFGSIFAAVLVAFPLWAGCGGAEDTGPAEAPSIGPGGPPGEGPGKAAAGSTSKGAATSAPDSKPKS